MNLIKKFMILSFMPIIYSNFNNFVNNSDIIYATEEIKNSESKLKSESGVSFEISDNYNPDSEKINIKIFALSEKDIKLENLEIEIIFDERIFKFVKKYFEFTDIFKTKLEDIDENTKILKISIKNQENINLFKNLNSEILNLDLNIKKKIPTYESDIKIVIKLDDNKYEENKHIKILNKNQIENININTEIKNQKFKFDNNINKYNLSVDDDKKYIIFEVETKDKNKKIIKKKLKKAGSTTNIKIGDYEFEIFRNEKKKSKSKNKTKKIKEIKKSKTIKEKIKNKKNKSNIENKKSNSKSKPKSNSEPKSGNIECSDEISDEECNVDTEYKRNSKDRDSIKTKSESKLESEELINNNNLNSDKINPNIIKIVIIIILVLILISVLIWIFYKKSKNKKNNNT